MSFGRPAGEVVPRLVKAASVAWVGVVVAYSVWWLTRQAIPLGLDWAGYRAGFYRFLATGMPYEPFQVNGTFTAVHLDFIHPPSFLTLVAPFALLPWPLDYLLWIGTPIVLLLVLLRRMPWWAWPIAALLASTDSVYYPIINGNSSLWMVAAFAWGLFIGWPAGLIAMKPSLLPLAVGGVHRPRPALVLAIVPILVTLPLWPTYITVLRNAHLPLDYSITQWALIWLAALPWITTAAPGDLRRSWAWIRVRTARARSRPRPSAG
jgi:hypothetical protein